MILYNVTIKVDPDVAKAWVEWMKKEHMPHLAATGLFVDSRLSRLLEQDESDGITYVAQYACENMAQYDQYISTHSAEMRAEMIRLFGGKCVAFRSLMEVIE